MSEFNRLLEDLKRARDEIQLRMHLASMEVKEEWNDLEGKWDDFSARADMGSTAEGLGSAFTQLGSELKQGYARIRDALTK